jgi:hypothetical protein
MNAMAPTMTPATINAARRIRRVVTCMVERQDAQDLPIQRRKSRESRRGSASVPTIGIEHMNIPPEPARLSKVDRADIST